MQDERSAADGAHASQESRPNGPTAAPDTREDSDDRDEEQAIGTARSGPDRSLEPSAPSPTQITSDEGTELETRPSSSASRSFSSWASHKKLPFLNGRPSPAMGPSPRVTALAEAYARSDIAAGMRAEVERLLAGPSSRDSRPDDSTDVNAIEVDPRAVTGYRRASWWTQFTILSGRAFKNLYRNPMLMLVHYVVSVALAREFCTQWWPKVAAVLT